MYTSTGRRRLTYTVAQAVIGARTFLLIYPSLGVRLSTCFLDSPTKLSPGTYLSKLSMIISAELNPLFNHFRNLCQWLGFYSSNIAGVDLFAFSIGVPVKPMKDAFGNASLRYFA